MSNARLINIAKLMTKYNFEIERLPDSLKCAQCKSVLKDARLVPCGCTFCRICIDDMMSRGCEFCPGNSVDCAETPLSSAAPDYRANKSVSTLIAKCAHNGCEHECQLADMEKHLRQCQMKNKECLYCQCGRSQNKFNPLDVESQFPLENRSHNQLLIGMITSMRKEFENMKERDEISRKNIEMMKAELKQKDEQILLLMDRMNHVENENKSIKEDNEDLANQIRLLSEKVDGDIEQRRQNAELDKARVTEQIEREITAITTVIGSNKNDFKVETDSILDHIRSIKAIVGLERIDARYDWTITNNLNMSAWHWGDMVSGVFSGTVNPYSFNLSSENNNRYNKNLVIWLRLNDGEQNENLTWPFEGQVIITVSDKYNLQAYRSISQQCIIGRPSFYGHSCSFPFIFKRSELIGAGLKLFLGVCVSCVIVPQENNLPT